ncbi:MAG: FHA domain-containing protein [Candidatus Rifleibacteriota bacterium]
MKLILETERGTRKEISKFPCLVGRSSSCDLTFDSNVASRKHAQFLEENDKAFVEDLGSSNGTFINLKQIKGKVEIFRGDLLKFGDVRFRVVLGPERP